MVELEHTHKRIRMAKELACALLEEHIKKKYNIIRPLAGVMATALVTMSNDRRIRTLFRLLDKYVSIYEDTVHGDITGAKYDPGILHIINEIISVNKKDMEILRDEISIALNQLENSYCLDVCAEYQG